MLELILFVLKSYKREWRRIGDNVRGGDLFTVYVSLENKSNRSRT